MIRADLHVHTTNTDCSETPESVFRMAKDNGVTHLAITDHDTFYGIEANRALAKTYGITYIPGIEVSAFDYEAGVKCHLIGLYVRPGYKPLDQMIEAITLQRHDNSGKQVQALIDLGYDVTWDDFEGRGGHHGLYKQHIMEVLIEKGIADTYYGETYGRLFKAGGPLAMTIDYPDHIQVVKALKESGAVPILAHPTLYGNLGAVDTLVAHGLQGIEAYYPASSPEDQRAIIALAKDYGLGVSGGSDYHGAYAGHSKGSVGDYTVGSLEGLHNR